MLDFEAAAGLRWFLARGVDVNANRRLHHAISRGRGLTITTQLPAVPDACGEGEDAQADARSDPVGDVAAVVLERELAHETHWGLRPPSVAADYWLNRSRHQSPRGRFSSPVGERATASTRCTLPHMYVK
jgi:hypothetical protein